MKSLIRQSPLYSVLYPLKRWLDHRRWVRNGKRPPASDLYKQQLVRETAALHRLRVLVETGTYLGNMVAATLSLFDMVYTIELAPDLARRARRRFNGARNVEVIEGSSASELPVLLARLCQPALFWLDAHYSSGITATSEVETPIMEELKMILEHPVRGHVILVDDARHFDGTHDYPTLGTVRTMIASLQGATFTMHADVIQITLPRR